MLRREWKHRIDDILTCIDRIRRYTSNVDRDRWTADEMLRDAVERNFITIGEAARHVPPDVTSRHPEVAWEKLRGVRNRVAHGYFDLDQQILWDTFHEDLPPLAEQLRRLLEAES